MANKLQIISNGQDFDLFQGEDENFYITKQIHDLANLETRNGDFSRRINLPLTPKNKEILGTNLPIYSRFDDIAVGTIPCEILVNGMPVLSNAYFTIDTQSKTAITIQVFGGVSKLYSGLSDLSIRDLDFSALNFQWTTAGINAITTNTTGVVYAESQWITNQEYREFLANAYETDEFSYQELNEAGFFIYAKTIIDKIFEGFSELTFDSTALDAQYGKSAIACPMPQLHEQYINGDTISTTVNVASFLPDISQREFLREVFKIYNIVATESNNLVRLRYFQSLATADSGTLVLDTNNEVTIYNTFTTYNQSNELKYSTYDLIERTDFDSSFDVNSEILPPLGTLVQSRFFPSDLGETPIKSAGGDRVVIPGYEFEYFASDLTFQKHSGASTWSTNDKSSLKVGDIVNVIQEKRRIVTVNSTNTAGTVDRDWTVNANTNTWDYVRYNKIETNLHFVSIEDVSAVSSYTTQYNGANNVIQGSAGAKVAQFPSALLWDNLKTTYYGLFVDSIAKPFIVQAWISLPTISLLKLDPLAPVYLDDYNSYFYINKLEQWKINNLARIELVEIKK
jgi:hypothetical protein